jgi:hypothetical protein
MITLSVGMKASASASSLLGPSMMLLLLYDVIQIRKEKIDFYSLF